MTLFHLGNCCALAFAPYFLTYKYSGLQEYGVLWKCGQAGAIYLLTQLCKMMFLATFFPTADVLPSDHLDLVEECFKCIVDTADLVGLHLVMSQVAGKGELKILVSGIGWATAELIVTRFVPLWVGARGLEFDWRYMQMSLDSNVSLVHHVATAALIWLWSRNDLRRSLLPFVGGLLIVTGCFQPLIIEIFTSIFGLDPWCALAFKAAVTIVTGLVSLQLYVGFTQGLSSY